MSCVKTASGVVAVLLLSAGSAVLCSGTHSASSQVWRCPANGGINVLYCYLRANGIACEYSRLVKDQMGEAKTRQTAAVLARVATRNGLPMRPFLLTIDQLWSCPKPVIVHIDGETPEAGAFLLLMSITKQSVFFVNGPSASIQSVSREDFRRIWSGIAVLPVTPRTNNVAFCAAGLIGGLMFAGIIRFIRRRRGV